MILINPQCVNIAHARFIANVIKFLWVYVSSLLKAKL